MEEIVLKEGREFPIKNKHHWIFSNAVLNKPEKCEGALLKVYSYKREMLGWGYFNEKCSLFGRMVNFTDEDPYQSIKNSFIAALKWRKSLFDREEEAFRLVNGEGDLLPGLVIDVYGQVAIMQISTLGMEKLKSFILKLIIDHLHPKSIYEKSLSPSRRLEGLKNQEGLLYGEEAQVCQFYENGAKYYFELSKGQKTGFFLDQREMRKMIKQFSNDKKVLDCCSYIGAFSISALFGGAKNSTLVDVSEKALLQAKHNLDENGFEGRYSLIASDIFEYLENEKLDFDIVILDPPAFAKKRQDVKKAFEAYRKLNELVFKKLKSKSLVLTSSCSYYMPLDLYKKAICQALLSAGRNGKIISGHRLAHDHPLSFFHPEIEYLKSFFILLD